MGLERLAMVSQGKKSIFETDLFAPVVKATEKILDLTGVPWDGPGHSSASSDESDHAPRRVRVMLCVAADHARALSFAISDGAIPSNEGRGYVLRGILRRALLFAHRVGVREPFLYRVSGEVVELMRQWYPELGGKREQTAMIIKAEEERFLRTLDAGLERWASVLEQHRAAGVIPGEELFRLHDTFGFHIELVKELAAEAKVSLDTAGFEQSMARQRERSRKEWVAGPAAESAGAEVEFVGYTRNDAETELVSFAVLPDGLFEVVLRESPFYAERGGQVGDTGLITGDDFELEVLDTYRRQGVNTCKVKVRRGSIKSGRVRAMIDVERRREIERAHTAAHLLHSALRRTLGDYVKQEGSLVEPGRLRFDFAAFEPLTPEQVQVIEQKVYEQVIADRPVEVLRDTPLEQAQEMGALAFFGDQYGEKVTVVKVGDFSMELCGGTHLRSTGQIGHFRITSETGVAAGVRRIEALVGRAAQQQAGRDRLTLDLLQEKLGVGADALVKKASTPGCGGSPRNWPGSSATNWPPPRTSAASGSWSLTCRVSSQPTCAWSRTACGNYSRSVTSGCSPAKTQHAPATSSLSAPTRSSSCPRAGWPESSVPRLAAVAVAGPTSPRVAASSTS
jgi:alanyl-tRNA synthetase